MRSQFGNLKFGTTTLVRYDCPKCKEKDSLFCRNECIHCGYYRGTDAVSAVKFTKRQINAIRGFRSEGNAQ